MQVLTIDTFLSVNYCRCFRQSRQEKGHLKGGLVVQVPAIGSTAELVASWIVRTGIVTIADAVAIAVTGAPAATLQGPAIVALAPLGTGIDITAAHFLVVALDPGVAAAAPVPVARNPFIAAARCRDRFTAQRRRRLWTTMTSVRVCCAWATGVKAAVLIRAAATVKRMRFMECSLLFGV